MNLIARRRGKPAANLIDADEAKRRAALELSLALRKAQRQQDEAVDTALTEFANVLGIDVVVSIAPD
jgi:hypothetical protein